MEACRCIYYPEDLQKSLQQEADANQGGISGWQAVQTPIRVTKSEVVVASMSAVANVTTQP